MCRDDTGNAFPVQCAQHGLSDGCAKFGISTRSEFVNEHKGARVGIFQDAFHVLEVGTVCRKFAFDGLLVTDINKYLVENAEYRSFIDRNHQA